MGTRAKGLGDPACVVAKRVLASLYIRPIQASGCRARSAGSTQHDTGRASHAHQRLEKRASEKEPVARPSLNKDVSPKDQKRAELRAAALKS
jgi:hypothetical protein